jgi:hypothetical protein
MGWIINDTPNGRAVWHDGGTNGFGTAIGFLPKEKVGIILLSNEENMAFEGAGFPDAVALWAFDKLLGNPETDYVQKALARARAGAATEEKLYRKPPGPRPPPDLASLAGDYASEEVGLAALRPDAGALVATLEETGARLRLEPFDGAVFTVRLVPEGHFAPVVASLGDSPLGFANFETNAAGHLTRLRWTPWGQAYLWRKEPDRNGAE